MSDRPILSTGSSLSYAITRRGWLSQQARTIVLSLGTSTLARSPRPWGYRGPAVKRSHPTSHEALHGVTSPEGWNAIAQRAVEAAMAGGARYAEARMTRTVQHLYTLQVYGKLIRDIEELGLGVRVLVGGYWGFAASSYATADEAVQLARDAIIQATEDAHGPPRTVEWTPLPAVTGRWTTPITIDPFHIPIEEKLDHIRSWKVCAAEHNVRFQKDWNLFQYLRFVRQERLLATSDGTLVAQTTYETSGRGGLEWGEGAGGEVSIDIQHLDPVARGWEAILDADVPGQIASARADYKDVGASKPATPNRVTLVCDGMTMARLLDSTLGVATQLDRALGYEANASGTSYLTDPLAMVGEYQVAAPGVTVLANRSAPTELATVQWDEEGVVPEDCTLVHDGVVVDFQTTREQAAWLAAYYHRRSRPVRSHGCAAAQNALFVPLQMPPNLALAPGAAAVGIDDMIKDVTTGILVQRGQLDRSDQQGRTGSLVGRMTEIRNGQLGRPISGGRILFDSLDLWKHITALGGPTTEAVVGIPGEFGQEKGEPGQAASHSVRAVAALIPNQPLVAR